MSFSLKCFRSCAVMIRSGCGCITSSVNASLVQSHFTRQTTHRSSVLYWCKLIFSPSILRGIFNHSSIKKDTKLKGWKSLVSTQGLRKEPILPIFISSLSQKIHDLFSLAVHWNLIRKGLSGRAAVKKLEGKQGKKVELCQIGDFITTDGIMNAEKCHQI